MIDKLKAIRADIDSALQAVASKHNLASLKCGSVAYTMTTFSFKLDGLAAGGKTVEAQRYESNAAALKLPPLGATVQSGLHTYKTVGLNTTGSKVYVERIPDGKPFLVPTIIVQRTAVTPGKAK